MHIDSSKIPFNYNDFDLMWDICDTHDYIIHSKSYKWIDYVSMAVLDKKIKGFEFKRFDNMRDDLTQFPINFIEFSTYEGCSDTTIKAVLHNGKRWFEVEIMVWEGDFVTGERTRRKIKATFKIKMNDLLVKELTWSIPVLAEHIFEEKEEAERQRKFIAVMNNMHNSALINNNRPVDYTR